MTLRRPGAEGCSRGFECRETKGKKKRKPRFIHSMNRSDRFRFQHILNDKIFNAKTFPRVFFTANKRNKTKEIKAKKKKIGFHQFRV